MKKNRIIGGVLLLSLFGFISCSKKIESKPQYVFKAQPKGLIVGYAAKVGEITISHEELNKGIENDIFDLEMKIYNLKNGRLKSVILKKLMEKHPGKKDLSNDKFFDKFIGTEAKVTKKDVEKFIETRGIPKQSINDKMKERINNFLMVEKKKKAVDLWVGKQTVKTPIEIFFNKPSRPVFTVNAGNAPYYGDPKAKVTVVEYSDFQCPFCKKGSDVINQIKKKYGKKIKIVYKNFPLPFHIFAKKAAEASLCANEQGMNKFWEMHDQMFANQTTLAVASLKGMAKKIGLNSKKFNNCLDSGQYEKAVEKDIAEGKKVGVKSTPTFFINGKIINGAHPIEVFDEVIKESM